MSSRSLNKVILIGNLGKDPEVKYTQGGMAIASFSLATSSSQKDKDGNWQEKTEWHNIKAFGRTAEIAGEYLKKGKTVYIEGRIHYDSWDDKDTGQKKYMTQILASDIILLGGRQGGAGAESAPARGSHPPRQPFPRRRQGKASKTSPRPWTPRTTTCHSEVWAPAGKVRRRGPLTLA